MTAEELRSALQAVPGVASAQVDEDEGGASPMVRLWLDGSRPGAAVEGDVDEVITSAGYRRRPAPPSESGRRAGLGRGLEALIPVALDEPPPMHLREAGPTLASMPATLAKIAIEESRRGVTVRVEDERGGHASAAVGEGGGALDEAVVGAVAELLGVGDAVELVAVDHRVVAGTDIVSVLIEAKSGSRYAGAAVVEGGRPFTVARAAHAALTNAG